MKDSGTREIYLPLFTQRKVKEYKYFNFELGMYLFTNIAITPLPELELEHDD